MRVDQKISL